MDDTTGEPATDSGLSGFLEPHEISGGCGVDLALVRRAVKERWPISEATRRQIMARLGTIVERDTVLIPSGMGEPFESAAVADRNAIAAAALLKSMSDEDRGYAMKAAGHIQAERHHGDKLAQDDKHLAVSWADMLAKATPDELIDAAIRLNKVDKLPPALRERAKAKMMR